MSAYKEYWAAVEPRYISDRILEKVEDYYAYLTTSGRLDLMKRCWSYYYRPRLNGGTLNPAGQQGELTSLSVNHLRNLLMHLETMTVQQRASFEPRAVNSDYESQAQCILAAGLLDYYMTEKRLERHVVKAVKDCLIFSEGFVRAEWEAQAGEKYGVTETGASVYQGDIKLSNYNPLSVIRDYTNESNADDTWYILRDFENKYTLAGKYPELADKILSESTDLLNLLKTTTLVPTTYEDSDNIAVYTLLHKPTPALPEGRFTSVLDNGTILIDGPIPYSETHVYRIAPDEETGTIFGYTVAFDLLPIQEAIDMLYSTVVTNQRAFGIQNITAPKGHDLGVNQISGGLNLIEYDPAIGKPEPLNLTHTPPEIFNFIAQLERLAETLSGVNSVARGNPEASLKSGAALALVQSMAIQFSMSLQRSYASLVEDLGTGLINILKTFAAVPRVAAIAGRSNRPLLREFTGQDLSAISRVTVEMGNPMTRTTAGKVNLAEALAAQNMIENPDQYIQVITTGRLEPVIQAKQAELLLIKAENEGLADGIAQRALVTDQHMQHILEHRTVLASPEIRRDPNSPVIQATLDHIQEHYDLLRTTDPALLALVHQQAINQGSGPAPQDGGTAQMLDANPSIIQQASEVRLPSAPNPPQGTDTRSAEIIQGMQ